MSKRPVSVMQYHTVSLSSLLNDKETATRYRKKVTKAFKRDKNFESTFAEDWQSVLVVLNAYSEMYEAQYINLRFSVSSSYVGISLYREFNSLKDVAGEGGRLVLLNIGLPRLVLSTHYESRIIKKAFYDMGFKANRVFKPEHAPVLAEHVAKKLNFFATKYSLTDSQKSDLLWLHEVHIAKIKNLRPMDYPKTKMKNEAQQSSNVHRIAQIAGLDCDMDKKELFLLSHLTIEDMKALVPAPFEWVKQIIGDKQWP